jgi:Putative prokaryotic signal transducing protein
MSEPQDRPLPWTMPAGAAIIEAMDLVRVYETIDPVGGLLVRGLLEADGIEVLAKGEGSGPYRMGPVILFVPADAADRAAELIRASEDGALALGADEGIEAAVTPAEDRMD